VTAIDVQGVTLLARGSVLLDDYSLRIEEGDVVALLGANGAGKTTLLRCILGLLCPTSGMVLLEGEQSLSLTAKRRAALVAHLAQHATSDDTLTVLEYVAAARFRHDEGQAASARAARAALRRLDAENLAERRLGPLSGGERQRVAIAALLAQAAKTLLLDEPANHLDPARQAQSYALLGELQQAGQTQLIVSHDINLLAHLAQPERVRVIGMKQGRHVFELPYGAESLCDALAELYGVPMRRFHEQGHQMIVPSIARHS
jgi:iron complex transport system ATP-binding protein